MEKGWQLGQQHRKGSSGKSENPQEGRDVGQGDKCGTGRDKGQVSSLLIRQLLEAGWAGRTGPGESAESPPGQAGSGAPGHRKAWSGMVVDRMRKGSVVRKGRGKEPPKRPSTDKRMSKM